jgi:hypothetical protein
VTQFSAHQLWINQATLSLYHRTAGNHPNDAILAHEAVFEKHPLAIPTHQARVNFEGLKYLEVMTEFCEGIANHKKGRVLPYNSENARTHNPLRATNVGECKVSTIVDVEVVIQVVGPDTQTDTSGRE